MEVIQWNEKLLKEIENSPERFNQTLFIETHPDYPTYLIASSLTGTPEETIPFLKLPYFFTEAEYSGTNQIILLNDLNLSYLDDLDEAYPYDLNITLKKFQLQGFNYTKDLPSALINWSTGTGKSVYAVARAKYLLETGKVDKVIIASKNHNKINWARTFATVGSLDIFVDTEVSGKDAATKRLNRSINYSSNSLLVVNYEKFRFASSGSSGDGQELLDAVKGLRVLWVWDEMPSKIRKMSTIHFKGIQKIMRSTKKNYQVALTATKIETDPENIYACMKILDPTIWPNKQSFRQMYAKSMSTFSPWQVATWDAKKLRELGMRISHITHVANKYTDPEISAEFPEEHWEDVIIEMTPNDQRIYKYAIDKVLKNVPMEYNSILTKMSVLQMICNNPASVHKSEGVLAKSLIAEMPRAFVDTHSAKLDILKEMLSNIDGKIVLFSMFNDFGAKMLMPYLAKWNVPFVLYDGAKKQEAEDRFREDPRIKVFLSSDQGSDSINLERATTVINYDLPWNYSTLHQRVNRISRLTSNAAHVYYYNLIMVDTIEERKLKVLMRKKGYEQAIDKPLDEQTELLLNSSVEELKWILSGQ